MKKILVIIAMKSEFEQINNNLSTKPVHIDRGFPGHEYYQVVIHDYLVLFALPGVEPSYSVDRIGPQNATLLTYEAINYFQPDLVVNAGTCGGFKSQGAEIGDVYMSTEPVFYHDRRIPLENFEGFGKGHYQPARIRFSSSISLKAGRVTTGSSLSASQQDLDNMTAGGAQCKEMELAAIAYVCQSMHIPWVGIKSVTDIVDCHLKTTEDEFLANLETASLNLKNKLFEFFSCLAL